MWAARAIVPIPSFPGFAANCPAHEARGDCVANCDCVWQPAAKACVAWDDRSRPYETMNACAYNDTLLTLVILVFVIFICAYFAAVVVCLFCSLACGCGCFCRSRRKLTSEEYDSMFAMRNIHRIRTPRPGQQRIREKYAGEPT